jgi:hypothetical protein
VEGRLGVQPPHAARRPSDHAGAKRFLTVAGLPGGIRATSVRLTGRAARGLFAKHPTAPNRCRYETSAQIAGPEGKVTVSGGTSTGLCH